ncbi:unnamed protein product [Lampetra fluviatilis]
MRSRSSQVTSRLCNSSSSCRSEAMDVQTPLTVTSQRDPLTTHPQHEETPRGTSEFVPHLAAPRGAATAALMSPTVRAGAAAALV